MYINGAFHLSYCTNVHRAETWTELFSVLNDHIPTIKDKISKENPFGISLRLSQKASQELSEDNNLDIFKDWLLIHNLYVFSINGVVFGKMHENNIKDLVYAPDWSSKDRLRYTRRLIKQLCAIMPENVTGSITTSPIGYRYWYSNEEEVNKCYIKSAKNLIKLVAELYNLECDTGKYIHLDLKPESNSLLSNSTQVIDFFRAYLLPTGVEVLPQLIDRISQDVEDIVLRYINICYNVSDFFMAFEEPSFTFKRFKHTKIKVGKIQLSSILRLMMHENNKEQILNLFSKFNQDRFLHHVSEKIGETVITYPDLMDVVQRHSEIEELRAQFKIPVYIDKFYALGSNQDQIVDVIRYLKVNNVCDQIEVETYTWELLPEELKTNLISSLAEELIWVRYKMEENSTPD
ncbi:metabolite traffic protein EboE [Galbibacter sp. BG1]|uniref:metabolite traffic protein EboE n=1 Tax=Galbibacter sp. BG1 TaxID=1170699 RepID=UPI0015BCE6A7|nr:metabolite traffic protein EboE [Galbibacter sp. BG1]QLE02970.1 metabolite traffic protein EboE [Galbibacter sp. BG1]